MTEIQNELVSGHSITELNVSIYLYVKQELHCQDFEMMIWRRLINQFGSKTGVQRGMGTV
jgi:hypothetical protein